MPAPDDDADSMEAEERELERRCEALANLAADWPDDSDEATLIDRISEVIYIGRAAEALAALRAAGLT